jgi:ABC-2 type transport system permease protein
MIISLILFIIGLAVYDPVPLANYLWFLLAFMYGWIIGLSINLLVGTLAFYTTESKSFRNVCLHSIRLLSGLWIPLFLFPPTFKTILFALPFAHVVYFPVYILQTKQITHEDISHIFLAGVWAVVLSMVSFAVWKFSIRKYEAIGI